MTTKTKKMLAANRRLAAIKPLLTHSRNDPGKMTFKSILKLPSLRVATGGMALLGLAHLAKKVSSEYPKVGKYFSKNIHQAEELLRDWTNQSEDMTSARH